MNWTIWTNKALDDWRNNSRRVTKRYVVKYNIMPGVFPEWFNEHAWLKMLGWSF